jgi:hypothetical protein
LLQASIIFFLSKYPEGITEEVIIEKLNIEKIFFINFLHILPGLVTENNEKYTLNWNFQSSLNYIDIFSKVKY